MEGKETLQLDMWTTAVASMQKYLRSESLNGKVYLAELDDDFKLMQSGELVNKLFFFFFFLPTVIIGLFYPR
jgi:mannosyl-oligosaccharide alpha-1,2-mannosidase